MFCEQIQQTIIGQNRLQWLWSLCFHTHRVVGPRVHLTMQRGPSSLWLEDGGGGWTECRHRTGLESVKWIWWFTICRFAGSPYVDFHWGGRSQIRTRLRNCRHFNLERTFSTDFLNLFIHLFWFRRNLKSMLFIKHALSVDFVDLEPALFNDALTFSIDPDGSAITSKQ